MAFGLDDLANFVEGLRRTFKGSSEPTSVQRNIQQGVVDPLRMGAELSGVNQAYRGARPDASGVDKALGLLALSGAMTGAGASDDIARVATKAGTKGKQVARSANPVNKIKSKKNIYGIHFSPEPGLRTIDSTNPNAAKLWDDSIGDANYFFNMDTMDRRKMLKMLEYLKMYGNKQSGITGSMYMVKAPRKGSFTDLNDLSKGSRGEQIDDLFRDILSDNRKVYPFDASDLDMSRPYRDPFLDGQMFSRSPLKVVQEFPLARGMNMEDVGFFEYGPLSLRPFQTVDPKTFYSSLREFNKKNPGAKSTNESWIKFSEDASGSARGNRTPFKPIAVSDRKDFERYKELESKVNALKTWIKENTGGRGVYKDDYNKAIGNNPALMLGDEFPDDVLLRSSIIPKRDTGGSARLTKKFVESKSKRK